MSQQELLATIHLSKLQRAAHWVKNVDADVWLFNGEIQDNTVDNLIWSVRVTPAVQRKKSFALFLTTNGGDPDAGYRLARFVKRTYHEGKFILYVFGKCKSSGTLISLAADERVVGDFGELGPLDIQLSKEDDFLHNISGLCYIEALATLREQSFEMFERQFLEIQARSGGNITAKTAAEIASRLATDLLAPIAGQIEPVKLGEVGRSINISTRYGERLIPLNIEAVRALTSKYPSHSFVIDREEAGKIFGENTVRAPNEDESIVEELLFQHLRNELPQPVILRINEQVFSSPDEGAAESSKSSNPGENRELLGSDSELHPRAVEEQQPSTQSVSEEGALVAP